MSTLIDKLNYIGATKTAIKDAIVAKGVPVTDDDTFRSYAGKITDIETEPNLQDKTVDVIENGSQNITADAGYDGLGTVAVNVNVPGGELVNVAGMISQFSSEIVKVPDIFTYFDGTSMNSLFSSCSSLTDISPLANWDTSKVTDMYGVFNGCSSLTDISPLANWNTSKVEKLAWAFSKCNFSDATPLANLFASTHNDIGACFAECKNLVKLPPIDLTSCLNTGRMFDGCSKLNKITFTGDPSTIGSEWGGDLKGMFGYTESAKLANNGTLIYDHRYDYTKIIEELHKYNPTWKAKTDYEPQECTSLSITADDVIGQATTTTIHYTAVTNGIYAITGEQITNIKVTGDVQSEPFEQNPSRTDSRQITVSFTYLGCNATTTINQGPKLPAAVTPDLMSNWELAPAETIPSPDLSVYSPVYQSVHKGQDWAKDKMIINIVDMPDFELYIRSYAQSNYDYVFAGKLDETEPSEFVSTKGKQNAGTDLASYTKVEYPNDGGQHTITVVYIKDSWGDSGDDRGYVFWKKPVEA